MGVNVTQLLNEEIKVIVEGGDNIATKTELNAGLDLKANKVVGGVFDGMDLKAAVEKLNTDKQNVIADSGVLTLSLTEAYVTGGLVHYRKVGQVVTVYGEIQMNNTSGAGVSVGRLPVGYRPLYTPFQGSMIIFARMGGTSTRADMNSSGEIYIVTTTSGRVDINTTYIVN